MSVPRKAGIFVILVIVIGSMVWGIRFSSSIFKKKFSSIINDHISKTLPGHITWRKCNLHFLKSTIDLSDVSFSPATQCQLSILSAKEVKIRYSLINLISLRKAFFSDFCLDGLQGKLVVSPLKGYDEGIIRQEASLLRDRLQEPLFGIVKTFRNIHVEHGELEVFFPGTGKEVVLREVDVHARISHQRVLSINLHIPSLMVGESGRTELFSLTGTELQLTKDTLSLGHLSLSSRKKDEKLTLQGEIGQLLDRSPRLDISYDVRIQGERLKSWYTHIPVNAQHYLIHGQVKGTMQDPQFSGEVGISGLRFEARPFWPVQKAGFTFSCRDRKISFSHIFLSALGGEIHGQGAFCLPTGKLFLDASFSHLTSSCLFTSLSSQSRSHKLPFLAEIQKRYPHGDGTMCFEGELSPDHKVRGAGEMKVRFYPHVPLKGGDLSWESKLYVLENKKIRFKDSAVRLGRAFSMDFTGDIHWKGTENFEDFSFLAQCTDLSVGKGFFPSLQGKALGGALLFQGEISGSLSRPLIRGFLQGQNITFHKYQVQEIEGKVHSDDQYIHLSDVQLQQNRTRITVNGAISRQNGQGTLQATADPVYFQDLKQILKLRTPILMEGKMACRSEFQILPGSRERFHGSGRITTETWSIADERHPLFQQSFDSVRSRFEVDAHVFHLYQTVGWHGSQKVSAELVIPYRRWKSEAIFQFSSEDFELSRLDLIRNKQVPLEGSASFQVSGKGSLTYGNWHGQAITQELKYEVYHGDQATVSLFMCAGDYGGRATIGNDVFTVSGKLKDGISYQLLGQISHFPFGPDLSCPYLLSKKLRCSLPGISFGFSGQIKACGRLKDFCRSEGELFVQEAVIQLPFQTLTLCQPFLISCRTGHVSVPSGHFAGEGMEATLSGEAVWGKTIDFLFSGSSSLAALVKECNFLSDPRGMAHYNVSICGPLSKPRFSGNLRLSHGALGINQLNQRLEEIEGDLVIDKHSILIEKLRGTSQTGKIALSGRLNFDALKIESGYLDLKGESILFSYSKRDKFLVDGDLHWQVMRDSSTLEGTIRVREGRYHRDVGLLQSLLTRRRKIEIDDKGMSASQTPGLEWLNNMSCHIRIEVPQDVWITSPFYHMEISTSALTMKGSFRQPSFEGQVRSQNGTIFLGGNKFRILSGLLELTDPDQQFPALDLSATADIGVYQITANIFGPIDDPRIRLSSIPYLPPSDIANMIALGISSSGEAEDGLIGQVATATSSFLSDILGQEMTTFSGIDLFRTKVLNRDFFQVDIFKLKVGEESGTVEGITVGKDITKRLQIKYSIPANEDGRDITEADYRLSDYIKLIGSQDDTGTYSLDLNFSLEF